MFEDRFRRAAPVIAGAIARGELPAATDPAELIWTLIAPIYLRLLVTTEPIDENTADNVARVALAAALNSSIGLATRHHQHHRLGSRAAQRRGLPRCKVSRVRVVSP